MTLGNPAAVAEGLAKLGENARLVKLNELLGPVTTDRVLLQWRALLVTELNNRKAWPSNGEREPQVSAFDVLDDGA